MNYSLPSSCPWNSPGQNAGVELFPSPGDLPNPGIEPRSPTMQADSLLSEPPGKPIDILGGDVKYGVDYMILDFRRKVRTEILNLGDIM